MLASATRRRSSVRSASHREAARRNRAMKSGMSASRAHIGAAFVRSASRPIHSNHSAGASRVLNASRPRSTNTTTAEAIP